MVSISKPDIFATREQIREMDQIAIEKYQIPGILLMENAGAGAATVIRRHINDDDEVIIFCGRGNNGGDGFVIARHLHNQGIRVQVFFVGNLDDVPVESDPGINLRIICNMGLLPIEIHNVEELRSHLSSFSQKGIVIDALLGTGLKGSLRSPMLEIIQEIASWNRQIIAIDIPSGLDANTGEILGVALPAKLTITFGFAKKGFICAQGPRYAGEIFVVDISLPSALRKSLS